MPHKYNYSRKTGDNEITPLENYSETKQKPDCGVEKLPELLAKLQEEEETIWPQLCNTMKMRDLRQFAERLKQWATEFQCNLLLDYATTLESQIEAFDWDGLPKTIMSFPEVKSLIANG